jgi:2-polyprenyl-3-methyl-5-hydroxy-6-metoxy-1,4-benzoquinol methylase
MASQDPWNSVLWELIPGGARKILCLGPAANAVAAALQARQTADVQILEPPATDPNLWDWLRAEPWDTATPTPAEEAFDCIVCPDLLPYVRHPEDLLRRLRGRLKPDGHVVFGIPNHRHRQVIAALLDGRWLASAGADVLPMRFFTRREIEKLVFRTGLALADLRYRFDPQLESWRQSGLTAEVRVGPLRLSGLPPETAAELCTTQYWVRATPRPQPNRGLTSIVLVTQNQRVFACHCLARLARFTDCPCEVVVVDNGSADGTPAYLRTWPGIRLLENRLSRGFAGGVNQAIRASSGSQVLLLGTQVAVTTGWLERLLTALYSDDQTGFAGPCSNRGEDGQRVSVNYDETDRTGLDGFAWEWGQQHTGQYQQVDRLMACCLLIKREVIARIGLIDEHADSDAVDAGAYISKASRVGYKALLARDAFIHETTQLTHCDSGALSGPSPGLDAARRDRHMDLRPETKLDWIDLAHQGGEYGRLDCQAGWHHLIASRLHHKTILDVGAGLGRAKTRLAVNGNRVILQDPAPGLPVDLRDPVESLAAKSFDVVTAFDVIEHVAADEAFLAHLVRIAREHVFLTTPNYSHSRAANPCHCREYTAEQFLHLLRPYVVELLFAGTGEGDEVGLITTDPGAFRLHNYPSHAVLLRASPVHRLRPLPALGQG